MDYVKKVLPVTPDGSKRNWREGLRDWRWDGEAEEDAVGLEGGEG